MKIEFTPLSEGATWDQLEYHPVQEVAPDVIEQCTDNEEPDFWSVYAHLEWGGLECIADLETEADCISFIALVDSLFRNDTNMVWVVTDPSCNQMFKKIADNIFLFKEDRVVNPETNETEVYESEIQLSEYTDEEMFKCVEPFGYSYNEMCNWIDEGENYEIIAECIFEMEI